MFVAPPIVVTMAVASAAPQGRSAHQITAIDPAHAGLAEAATAEKWRGGPNYGGMCSCVERSRRPDTERTGKEQVSRTNREDREVFLDDREKNWAFFASGKANIDANA